MVQSSFRGPKFNSEHLLTTAYNSGSKSRRSSALLWHPKTSELVHTHTHTHIHVQVFSVLMMETQHIHRQLELREILKLPAATRKGGATSVDLPFSNS